MARLFVALDLPASFKASLEPYLAGLRGARFINPQMAHITLSFLGEVSPAHEHDIVNALAPIRTEPFDLHFEGLDTFGDRRRVRNLHLKVAPSRPLQELQHSVARAMSRCGVEDEHRRYTPHVTLARFKSADPVLIARYVQEMGRVSLPPVTVRGFTLFESHLLTTGAHYDPLMEFGGDNEIALAEPVYA